MNVLHNFQTLQQKFKTKLQLTEAQRRMYAAEKLENFRWISRLVATYSSYQLSDEKDLVPESQAQWVQEIGQFAEIVYSALPLEFLLSNYDIMRQQGFPLEGYYALSPNHPLPIPFSQNSSHDYAAAKSGGARLITSFKGSTANLPAAVFSRWIDENLKLPRDSPSDQTNEQLYPRNHAQTFSGRIRKRQQVIVSICGTSSASQSLHDLRAIRRLYPGLPTDDATVHSGFWDLYQGIKTGLLEGIREALKLTTERGEQEQSLRELVVTGHSMGGAAAHLLCIDLLSPVSEGPSHLCQLGFKTLQIVTFGEPRAGNQALADHWRTLKWRHQNELSIPVEEWCIKGYNDGVPALPPAAFGYRHFPEQPLYTMNGKLYRVPASEREHALFHVANTNVVDSNETSTSNSSSAKAPSYPLGGHNYYNERDLEGGFLRRIEWLSKAEHDREGWEERYREIMKKHLE